MGSPIGNEKVAIVHCPQSRPTAIFNELLRANGAKLVDGGYIQACHNARYMPSSGDDVGDVMVDDCALDNGAVEERPMIIRLGQQMAQNVGCAR